MPKCLHYGEHVRNALLFLQIKLGGWRALTKLLKFEEMTLIKSGNGSRTVTASMAFRIARLVEVTVDDLVHGKFPEPGTCPRCGYKSGHA
jgi:plasmid maintenance system antidote protein VapI